MSRTEKAIVVAVLAAAAVVGSLVLALLASYDAGEEFGPPPKPTPAELERIRDRSGFPVYWLGPSYRGKELNAVDPVDDVDAVILSYGGPYCDSFDEVCNYDLDVMTSRSRAPDTEDPSTGEPYPICWRRVGRALAFGCPDHDPTQVEVFTGSVRVRLHHNLDDGKAHPLLEALRPMKGGTLAAPKPFGCREMRQISARLRKRLPAQLRGCRRL